MYESYEEFINYLKTLRSTEEILYRVYCYFKDYVTYNYDELQIVKFNHYEGNIESIKKYSLDNPATEENKKVLLSMLDEAFMNLEGRPLTPKNREVFFRNYGRKVHYKGRPDEEVFAFGKKITIKRPEKTEILNGLCQDVREDKYGDPLVNNFSYSPVYHGNGMLKDAVCSEYAEWMNKICHELGITSYTVNGRGTTSHDWNAIYIEEKGIWVNFDMTMVRFYLDGWIKEHEPYTPDDWVLTSTDDMFKMQSTRKVYYVAGPNGNITIHSIDEYKSVLDKLTPTRNNTLNQGVKK